VISPISGIDQLFVRFPAKGSGIRVALLDSGTDTTHPAFASSDLEYRDLCNSPNETKDEVGHGTHCAGALLSVAPGCTLLSGRILMRGTMLAYDALLDGLQWAMSSNASVACVCTGHRYSMKAEESMIEEFSLAGGCLVSAIGNTGRSGKDAGVFPARYPHAIAAGSVDEYGNLLPFVEMPEGTEIFCFGGMPFTGPSLNHRYAEFGGTSISAALISGLIALAMSSGKLQVTPEFPTIKARLLAIMEKKESPRGPYYVFDPLKLG
jgi:subtilisin family serine protease